MHENSLKAYGQEHRKLSERAMAVLGVVTKLGQATDRQICKDLHYSDMNAVRPRVSELVQEGLLIEVSDTVDSDTGKTVRVLSLPNAKPQSDNLFDMPADPVPKIKSAYRMGY